MRHRTGRLRGKPQVGCHGLGRVETEAVGEHAEVAEQPLLVLGELVVGPLNGLPQRDGSTVAEQVQGAVESIVDVAQLQRCHPPAGVPLTVPSSHWRRA